MFQVQQDTLPQGTLRSDQEPMSVSSPGRWQPTAAEQARQRGATLLAGSVETGHLAGPHQGVGAFGSMSREKSRMGGVLMIKVPKEVHQAAAAAGELQTTDWPMAKKCCVGGHGDGSVRCDADAVFLAQDRTGLQWFVCGDRSHWIDVVLRYPLDDWHKRLDTVFSAEEAHRRLTGTEMDPAPDWRTIDCPGTAPVPGMAPGE